MFYSSVYSHERRKIIFLRINIKFFEVFSLVLISRKKEERKDVKSNKKKKNNGKREETK